MRWSVYRSLAGEKCKVLRQRSFALDPAAGRNATRITSACSFRSAERLLIGRRVLFLSAPVLSMQLTRVAPIVSTTISG